MPLSPAFIQNFSTGNQTLSHLQRISLDKPPYDEDWLQNLIDQNPGLVPAGEIESSFDDIIPVVRELPLPSGYLDNLYITPDGHPVLVEVKLWKNQEARRKVVAQILEYAKDFAGLKYEQLNDEIRKLRKKETWGGNPLHEIVSKQTPAPLDEAVFIDRVSRNMREGRFLLLILGDGIREDMENLANYLMHHSLRYAFGIIQIRLYTLPDGSILALPDVMAKTQTIERHVTVVTTQGADMSVREVAPQTVTEKLEKTSLSLDAFYEAMNRTAPESVSWLKGFLQSIADLPIEPQVGSNGDSLMLKATLGSGDTCTLMHINPPSAEFWGLANRVRKTPHGEKIARAYLDRIVAAISGASVKVFDTGNMDIRQNGKPVPLRSLHGKDEELKEAMRQAIQETAVLDEAA